MTKEQIAQNFAFVREQIREAERASNRAEGSVTLCAVSKFHSAQAVLSAISAGQTLFGENRVQEAVGKFKDVALQSDKPFELHIIGTLQKNKVKKAVEAATAIQSIDRAELLPQIEKYCAVLSKRIKVFFELHTGEESKSGYRSRDDLFLTLEGFERQLYPHITPAGLMTMAPFTDNEGLIRKSFIELRETRDEARKRFPSLPLNELSMGMTSDYRIAIEEGSTMVRLGTALFGPREEP